MINKTDESIQSTTVRSTSKTITSNFVVVEWPKIPVLILFLVYFWRACDLMTDIYYLDFVFLERKRLTFLLRKKYPFHVLTLDCSKKNLTQFIQDEVRDDTSSRSLIYSSNTVSDYYFKLHQRPGDSQTISSSDKPADNLLRCTERRDYEIGTPSHPIPLLKEQNWFLPYIGIWTTDQSQFKVMDQNNTRCSPIPVSI